MSTNTLTIVDNRTGKSYEVPIEHDTIPAIALRQIKVNPDDFGLMTYDPGYGNTASCKSSITYIDGDKGILLYRGYPIEQLAEQSNFLEVAYLLIYGELPTKNARQVGIRCAPPHIYPRKPGAHARSVPLRRPPHEHAHRLPVDYVDFLF